MKDGKMQEIIDIEQRKSDITRSFLSVFLIFAILLILSLVFIQNKFFEHLRNEYQKSLDRIANQIRLNESRHYKDILNQISLNNKLKKFIVLGKRDEVYKILKPKYALLQEQNPYIKVMQVINPNGASFIRIHNMSKFGDRLDNKRAMVRDSIKNHKFIEGFEGGVYANAYRLMMPLFIEGRYIGSLEIGINSNFFLRAIKKELGDKAFLFIKKENLQTNHKKIKFYKEDYFLQSETYADDREILKLFPAKMNLVPNFQIDFKNEVYILHVKDIKSFDGKEYGKFIFLEDMTKSLKYKNNVRLYMILLLLSFFIALLFLFNHYMRTLRKNLHNIHAKHTKELMARETYLYTVFDATPNILMSLINKKAENANKRFFEFTGFSSLKDFKLKHDCLCDLFIKRDGYLQSYMQGKYWVDYINTNKDTHHFAIMKKDEVEHIFQVFSNEVDYDDKNRYIIALVDVTEIFKIKNELEKNQKLLIAQSKQAAMGEMISMIAHQWRQPLSIISMSANNIITDIKLDMLNTKSLEEDLEDITNETFFLSQTIDDFRNFFKPDKEVEDGFVDEIINKAIGLIGKQLKNHNIKIICNFDKHQKITTYIRELTQVLLNLLNNSKDAFENKEDKTIHVETKTYANKVLISFFDNAGGIDEEIIERIFEPYFSTKEEKNGAGLGLYMSKTIIENHLKGTIRVYNKDGGACFEIVLPLVFGSWDRRAK